MRRSPKERIPESVIMRIVSNPSIDLRTRALIVASYACAARVGELVAYKHKVLKREAKQKKKQDRQYKWQPEDWEYIITHGLLKKNIFFFDDRIEIEIPNFKNYSYTAQREKRGFIFKESEKWMYDVFMEYYDTVTTDFFFSIHEAHARDLIDAELKKENPDYSTHWLRHSKATKLVVELNLNPVKAMRLLGHNQLSSTQIYLHTNIGDALKDIKEKYGERHD